MASLTGTKIQDTYDGLLKVSDNVGINSTKKIITDGLGNNSSVKISSEDFEVGGFFFVDIDGNIPDSKIGIGTNAPTETLHVVGDFRLTARFYDGSNSAGSSGKVLVSTGNATSWTNTFTTSMVFDSGVQFNAGIKDYTGSKGTAGQVLSSTGSNNFDIEWVSLSEIQGVDGSGTANYIPIWTDSDTLGNSVIYQSNSNIGIGTLSPGSYKLNVFGDFKLNSNGSGYMQSDYGDHRISIFDSSNNRVFTIQDLDGSSANQLVVASTGVGINVANPSEKLHVVGDALITGDSHADAFKPAVTSNPIKFKNFASTELARITDAGLFGIGTTAPSYKLSVTTGADIVANFYSTDSKSSILINDDDTSGWLGVEDSVMFMGGSSSGTGAINILTGIGNTGYVGIGTASPDALLDVDGWARMQNGVVENSIYVGDTVTHWGDGGTALRFNTDEILLQTASSTAVTINSSQNVGIGTTTPSEKLEVFGTIKVRTQGNGAIGQINLGNLTKLYADNGEFRIKNNTTTLVTVQSGGSVGIGTTSPTTKLDISDSNPFITIQGTSASYVNGGIQFISKHASTARGLGNFYYCENSDVEWFSGLPYNNNDAFVINRNTGYTVPSSSSSPPGIGASAGTKFIINSSGNVGIGTNSPSVKFEVNGGSSVAAFFKSTANTVPVSLFTTNNAISTIGFRGLGSTSEYHVRVGTNVNDFVAYTNNTERMRIDSSGGVKFNEYGSGTFTGTATQRLAVDSSGNIIEVPIGSGAVDGTGTANKVTMWSDADTLTDAPITISGSDATFSNDITATGHVYADTHFRSTDGNATLSATGGGAVYLRPNGYSSTTGQVVITASSGDATFNGGIQVSESAAIHGTDNQTAAIFMSTGGLKGRFASTYARNLISSNGSSTITIGDNTSLIDSIQLKAGSSAVNGVIQFLTKSSEKMRITSDGLVGIGTTNPERKLSVTSGTIVSSVFRGTNGTGHLIDLRHTNTADGYNGFRFYDEDTNRMNLTHIQTGTRGYIQIGNNWAAGAEILVVDGDNQRVGIGTISPSEKLEISGTGELSAKINNTQYSRSFTITQGGGYSHLKTSHSSGVAINYGQGNAGILSLFNNTTQAIKINANGNSYFNGGNIGIGTTAPSFPVHVYTGGSERFAISGDVFVRGATDLKITGTSRRLSFDSGTGTVRTSTSNNLILQTNSTTALTLDTLQNATFAGDVIIGDNKTLLLGSSDDLEIYHDGSNSRIENNTGHLYIRNDANNSDIIFQTDDGGGNVATYFFLDGSSVTTQFYKTIKLYDAAFLYIGDGNDLQFYHNGTNSTIANYTGTLYIANNQNDGDIAFQCDDGSGGLTEYFRLDGGITKVVANKNFIFEDGIQAQFGSSSDLNIYHSGTSSVIQNATGNLTIQQDHNNSDIIFRCDDGSNGTTEYFKLDGTNTRILVSKPINLIDDVPLQLGNSQDLRIYHNGNNSYIQDAGIGSLKILAQDFDVTNSAESALMIRAIDGAQVELYYGGAKKFETNSQGATVTGGLTVTGDLNIYGDINTQNINNLDVVDKVITVGKGQLESASGGSGIVVDGSGASILWNELNNEWELNKDLSIYTGAGLATFIIGRNPSEKLTIDQTDNETVFTAINDADGDSEHNFRFNRVFQGTGANNFKIQKGGTDQLTIDTNANATFSGSVEMASGKITSDGSAAAGAYLELKHANNNSTDVCATINLTNNVGGYAAIVGGTTGVNNTGYIEFKTDNAGTQGTVLTLNGDNSATFEGNVLAKNRLTVGQNTVNGSYGLYAAGSFGVGGNATFAGYVKSALGFRMASGQAIDFIDTNIGYNSIERNTTVGGLQINTGASARINILDTGNIGIGTTSPNSKLEVAKGSEGDYLIVGGDNASNSRALVFTSSTATSNGALHTIRAQSGNGQIAFSTATSEALRIDSSQKVGIGNTSPNSYYANANNLVVGSHTGSNGISILSATNQTGWLVFADSTSGGDNTRGAISYNHDNNSMTLRVNNAGLMTLKDSKVGIGTTNPTQTLDVDGAIITEDYRSASTFYLTSGDDWRFRTDTGSERMRITSAGFVGIGTASPSTKLHVYNGEVTIASSTDGVKLSYSNGNSSGIIDTAFSDNNLEFRTNGTAKMWIANDGKVGIGTTSPQEKFAVTGGNIALDNGGAYILGGATTSSIIGRLKNTSGVYTLDGEGTRNIRLGSETNGEVVRIDNTNGNVGIGTTAPSEKLEVEGNILVTSDSSTSLKIQAKNASSFNDPVLEFVTWNVASGASSGKIQLTNGAWNNNDMAFFTETSNSVTEKMRIASNGNVGIGTTTPTNFGTGSHLITVQSASGGGYGGFIAKTDNVTGQLWANEGGSNVYLGTRSNHPLILTINNLEKARIDSAGDMTINGGRLYVKESDLGNTAVAITRDADEGYLQLFSSGTQTVELRGNGNSYFNGGNIGIGTTSPASKLHLYDGDFRITGVFPRIYLQDSNNDSDFSIINGNGNLRFYDDTNATDRLYISAAGNIGIGTISPVSALHIESANPNLNLIASSGNPFFRIGNATSGSRKELTFTYDMTSNYASIQAIEQGVATRNIAINPSGGNVGIGTTSPGTNLQVNSSTNTATSIGISNTGSGASRLYMDASNGDFSGSDYMWIGQNDDKSGEIFMAQNSGSFHIKTQPGGTFTTQFTVTQNGLVGIGTASPNKKLHVYDANAAAIKIQAGDANQARLDLANSAGAFGLITSGGTFRIYDDTDAAERLRIDTSGNIGIGTTSPTSISANTSSLTVGSTRTDLTGAIIYQANGSIKAQSYWDSTGWLTYVNSGVARWYTGGSERMRLSTDGYLGINTTLPVNPLHVEGNFTLRGNQYMGDNEKLILGLGSDLQIYHNGSDSVIESDTGDLYITNKADGRDIFFRCDDGSGGYTTYFYLAGAGTNVNFQKDAIFVDDVKANFGNAGDLQIYHDGSNSYISDQGTGLLKILSNGVEIKNAGDTGYMAFFGSTGASELYYNGSRKLETTSDGVLVSGFLESKKSDTGAGYNDGIARFVNETTATSGGSAVINVRNTYGIGFGGLIKFWSTSTATSVGNISFNSSRTAVNYNTGSDYRLKEDYRDFNGLDLTSKIKVYDFKWKNQDDRSYGVIAHELDQVVPGAVTGEKDAEDMQCVDYSKLVPLLIKSVQELKAENLALKARVSALENN